MTERRSPMQTTALSLSDITGAAYTEAVCAARAFLAGADRQRLVAIANEKVELAPSWYQRRLDELVDVIGQQVCPGLGASAQGAGTDAFNAATKTQAAPLNGFGFIRIGEDGRAYLASKSEHYHASLGHSFPGYRLIDNARALGIPNATHNNTRGHITRCLEERLIQVANGIPRDDDARLRRTLDTGAPHVLNRVINLETGSLAVEAALKMMLARFYRLDEHADPPLYAGRTPVFLVLADRAGGRKANYHGTTVLTQVMRDMWPEVRERLEAESIFVVEPVQINDLEDFERALHHYDAGEMKVAGFFHELILMNYGGIRLEEAYIQRVYKLCHARDVPVIVDEIQSCIWSPDYFLFREYGLNPDFVSVGKGFPGGEYPASRILGTAALDNLNQFGALVTNGQEELASLAYLVTMAFVEANGAYIRDVGDAYASALAGLARAYPDLIDRIEGQRHLSSIFFRSVEKTVAFVHALADAGIDISAHTYKAECPPAALTKIPLIATYKLVDFLAAKMDAVLRGL